MTEPEKDPRQVAAEIAKLEAETAKLNLERESLSVDIRLKEAEARQKIAHAISAEHGAESMRVQTEATVRQEKLSLATNHYHHEYLFSEPMYDEAVENCLAQLAVWHRLDPECSMKVVIRSPGGSALAGMHLFDEIDQYSLRGGGAHRTIGVVRGMAASMASIFLQAFDERLIGKQATLMIHEVSSWAQGKIGEIEDELKFLKKLSHQVAEIFVARSREAKEANPSIDGITLGVFETAWHRQEWYLSAAETVNLGLADRLG